MGVKLLATYTIELYKLLDFNYHLNLDYYPIFDESYRKVLNQKIIDHFYFREIGQETPDRFNFMLGRKLNEIMPYYNQLYMSELLKFDPLASEYITENTSRETEQNRKTDMRNKYKSDETVGDVYSSNTSTDQSTNLTGNQKTDVTGNYEKQGDETINKTGNQTDDLKEDITENITSNSTTTNDLTTHTTSENDGTGKNTTIGTKNSVFSDIPQSGINTTQTIAPDGTITIESQGYATTTTNDSTNETANSETHAEGTSDVTNTGTVKVDGSSERIQNKTNDNTINTTEETTKHWNENGNNTSNTNFDETQDTKLNNLEKEDSERNVARNNSSQTYRNEKELQNEYLKNIMNLKGRRGVSPSKLLNDFRSTFLNIDMQIITELEPLFMGLF